LQAASHRIVRIEAVRAWRGRHPALRSRSFADDPSVRAAARVYADPSGIWDFATSPPEDSLLTRNQVTGASSKDAVSRNALRRAPITFASREIHSETFRR